MPTPYSVQSEEYIDGFKQIFIDTKGNQWWSNAHEPIYVCGPIPDRLRSFEEDEWETKLVQWLNSPLEILATAPEMKSEVDNE